MQGRREHEGTILEGLDPRRRTYYWIEEGKDQLDDRRACPDIHAVRSGLISITPLHNDTTHHAVLAAFRAWEPTLGNGRTSRRPVNGARLARSSRPRDRVAAVVSFDRGRGSAWLERSVRDQEVGGSNPLAPTTIDSITYSDGPKASKGAFRAPGATTLA